MLLGWRQENMHSPGKRRLTTWCYNFYIENESLNRSYFLIWVYGFHFERISPMRIIDTVFQFLSKYLMCGCSCVSVYCVYMLFIRIRIKHVHKLATLLVNLCPPFSFFCEVKPEERFCENDFFETAPPQSTFNSIRPTPQNYREIYSQILIILSEMCRLC
jgi:hypothetical protein